MPETQTLSLANKIAELLGRDPSSGDQAVAILGDTKVSHKDAKARLANYGIETSADSIYRWRKNLREGKTNETRRTKHSPPIAQADNYVDIDQEVGEITVGHLVGPGEAVDPDSIVAEVIKNYGLTPEDFKPKKIWVGQDDQGRTRISAQLDIIPETAVEDTAPLTAHDLIQLHPKVEIANYKATSAKKPTDVQTFIVIPDEQIGYAVSGNQVIPLHDERCMDIALQICADLQPDTVVHTGDTNDLATLSSFRNVPGMNVSTERMGLDRAHLWLASMRQYTNKHVLVEGNHDKRIINYVLDNAPALFGLTRAMSVDEQALLSIPFILGLDELDIEYVGGYPAGRYWITDSLCVIHGNKTSSSGSVANALLKDVTYSTLYGHTHQADLQWKSILSGKGRRDLFAGTPGTFARVDGVVPGTKQGMDASGALAENLDYNWQQGIMVGTYDPNNPGSETVELHTIRDGRCIFRGQEYTSDLDINHIDPAIAERHNLSI